MISEYIDMGFDHILDPKGLDHILYVASLCCLYFIQDWRKILALVTAFTLGHCVTLALSSLRIINISESLVETLIPLTILASAVYNIYVKVAAKEGKTSLTNHFGLTLLFGLIHGLGFSNYFRALFEPNESIVIPLLGFNIGVELGQILIVASLSIIGYLISRFGPKAQYWWTIGLSAIIGIWALKLILA